MSGAYVVLSGAKRNVGDFLIVERALALLRRLRPDRELRVTPGWEPLDPNGEVLCDARAILIAGGPGYQPAFYPKVYPLCPSLDDLPCPVIPVGVGWKGPAGDGYALRQYRFSRASLAALHWMAQRTRALGCRDGLSVEVLRRHGIGSAELVGCPVWYDLPSLGKPVEPPAKIERVLFTPAQLHGLRGQSVEVARRIAELWPEAEKICSFHRGLDEVGPWLPPADAANNRSIAESVDALGFDVVDVTGDVSKLGFYDACTLHVGYRVHAHLYFLGRRRPSLLIEEDGRGAGAAQALGVAGVRAFRPDRIGRLRRAVGRFAPAYRVDERAPVRVERMLASDIEARFARFDRLAPTLDGFFSRMEAFIHGLP